VSGISESYLSGEAREDRQVNSPEVAYYFERFGFCPQQIAEPPHPNLGMVVVLPCYNEPNLLAALESLWRCDRPEMAVEVIVVINSGEGASPEVKEQNLRTLKEASSWSREDCDRYSRVHLLHFPDLPRKHAGVGLARKIGMDEALRRFDAVNWLDGVIACFDADSGCDANYLVELEKHFATHPKSPGCAVYFEHPLEGPEDPSLYEAIAFYELHLRYYVQALRFAGFPHAFHTIGSSMAVRADAYLKQGGMNKRQAGEDFYFLHKIIPLGNFSEVNTTRVIPSPRPSDRVPFGTGRAVRDYLVSGKFETYPLQAFRDLKALFGNVDEMWEKEAPRRPALALPLQQFLEQQKFASMVEEIRKNTSSPEAFRKRFFRWFDGFMAMKYIHYARDTAHGPAQIVPSVCDLLNDSGKTARELLLSLRNIQRGIIAI
jgi:glycosyltransferase involved in cell wall biosynthesis